MPRRRATEADRSEEAAVLDRATRAFRRTEETYERQRRELWEAILAAEARGMSKSEIARRTGYTREYVTELLTRLKRDRVAAASEPD